MLAAPQLVAVPHVAPLSDLPAVRRDLVISDDLGLWLGFFMGDGSVYNATVSLVCDKKDEDCVDVWERLNASLFGVQSARRAVGTNKGGVEIRYASLQVAALLDDLGCTKPSGKAEQRMRQVCVPEAIWRSPRSVVRQFLRGLFESDGYNEFRNPRVALFSKSEAFLRDVQLLLLVVRR